MHRQANNSTGERDKEPTKQRHVEQINRTNNTQNKASVRKTDKHRRTKKANGQRTHGQTNRQTTKQKQYRTNTQTDKHITTHTQTNIQTHNQTNKRTSKQTHKQPSRQASRPTNKRANKQMNKQTDNRQSPTHTETCMKRHTIKQAGMQTSTKARRHSNR